MGGIQNRLELLPRHHGRNSYAVDAKTKPYSPVDLSKLMISIFCRPKTNAQGPEQFTLSKNFYPEACATLRPGYSQALVRNWSKFSLLRYHDHDNCFNIHFVSHKYSRICFDLHMLFPPTHMCTSKLRWIYLTYNEPILVNACLTDYY